MRRRRSRSGQGVKRSPGRWVKAQIRYFRIALSLFWRSLLALFLLWFSGGMAFYFYGGVACRGFWGPSLWAALELMAAEPAYSFPKEWPLQVAYFTMPLLGLLLVAESVVRFSLLLLDKRANEKEWMEAMAATARNHIILCGLGSIGYRIIEEFIALNQEVVAIEKDAQGAYLGRARDLGATILIDDATVETVLLRAGLLESRAVIAATNSDIDNLEIALDARRMHPGIRVVMRIFDEKTALKIREAFGIETLSSATLSAPTFALSALGPDILGSVRIGDALLVTAEIAVEADSPWAGKRISEIAKRFQVVVVSHREGEQAPRVSPSGEIVLHAGDRLALQGALGEISAARDDAHSRVEAQARQSG